MSVAESDALFFHNPPGDPALRRELFVGREHELALLARRIPGSLRGPIRAIHGDSRVGKSHLALHFLHSLPNLHLVTVGASSGRKARLILQDLYESLREKLGQLEDQAAAEPDTLGLLDPRSRLPVPRSSKAAEGAVSSYQILHDALGRIVEMDDVLLDLAQSSEQVSGSATESQAGLSLGASGWGLTGGLSGSEKQSSSTGQKQVRTKPDEYGLTRILGQMCEALYLCTGQPVLVYVDDVDLLDSGPDADQQEVVRLVRCLHRLAQCKGVTVSASLRTRHLDIGDKEFSEAVRVRPLSDDELRQVYERHVQLLNNGQPVLSPDCLEALIRHVAGKVGAFLRLCYRFRDFGLLHQPGQVLQVTDLEEFLAEQIRDLRGTPEYRRYIDQIVTAAKTSREVQLDEKVLDTPLIYTLLEEPPGLGAAPFFQIAYMTVPALRRTHPSELPPPSGEPLAPPTRPR